MSEPTKELLLNWLNGYGRDEYKPRCSIRSGEFNETMRQALCSLVGVYFKWQEEATLIRRKYPDNLLPAATAILLDRIRDFDFSLEVEEIEEER